jgi:lysophospholipase L1-like esterase
MKRTKERPQRNARFVLIALLLPILALGLVEGALRLFGYGNDLALFVPAPPGFANRDLLRVNPEIARRYFTQDGRVPHPLPDFFMRRKPVNGYRIFVMGESATAGYPYPGNVAFSRILQGRLADAFPDRTVEIVNLALTATNSYALADLIDEILAQQPDAILIYAGHNEFYGALGAASTVSLGPLHRQVRAYLWLRRLWIFQAMENGLSRFNNASGITVHDQAEGAPLTLMGRMAGNTSIVYGSTGYLRARDQFEANLRMVLGKAKAAAVPVVISDLVCNLRDQAPFASSGSDPLQRADDVFRDARALEDRGSYDVARAAYMRARDLDVLRFRAPEEFNSIIHRVAEEFGLPVVPMKSYFEAASPHGLVGSGLMLEHLHPNVEGQLLMSQAFLDMMRKRGMIAARWDDVRVKPLAYYREHWPVSDLDRELGAVRVRQLTDYWPFKPQIDSGKEWPRYQPNGLVETLAFKVATHRTRLSEAYIYLAKYYESLGQHDAALREYRSLAAAGVWEYQAQISAAQQLIEAKQFSSALPFLEASRKLKDTSYADEWISRISGARSDGRTP